MADVFEEVEEQLRSARVIAIIAKAWPWILGVIVAGVLITLGIWGWGQYQAAESAKASETYQQGLDALGRRDQAAAEKAFGDVAKSGPKAFKALALMQMAGIRSASGRSAEAVGLLDDAATAAPDAIVGDAARLKAAWLLFDTASLADLEGRLTPLTQTGHPYVTLAREALAMKRLAAGQTAQARQALAVLAIAPDASEGMQARAQIAMAMIDAGQAGLVPAVAKAAAALPPAAVAAARAVAQQQAAARAAAEQAQAQAQAQAPGGQAGAPPQAAQTQPGAPQ